jgi:thioredoxin 2
MPTEVETLDDATLARTIEEPECLVVLDFWAPWCGPCRAAAPIFAEVSRDYSGQARFVSVNVDEQPAVAQRFGVRAIPTIVVVRGGRTLASAIGAQPASRLREMIDASL